MVKAPPGRIPLGFAISRQAREGAAAAWMLLCRMQRASASAARDFKQTSALKVPDEMIAYIISGMQKFLESGSILATMQRESNMPKIRYYEAAAFSLPPLRKRDGGDSQPPPHQSLAQYEYTLKASRRRMLLFIYGAVSPYWGIAAFSAGMVGCLVCLQDP